MNKRILAFVFLILTFVISSAIPQDKPRRAYMPLDEEAEMIAKIRPGAKGRTQMQSPLSSFPNVNISGDSSPQNEPSVKISRKDPSRVVAAWRDFRRGVSNPTNRQVGYSISTDGGITWSESMLLDSTLLPGFPRNSDPVVAVDSAGNFYIAVVCIGNSGGLGVYKSTDGGETFPQAYLVANTGSEDKEWMDNDRVPGSPYLDRLYMSWTRFSGNTGIKVSYSSNSGVNWSDGVSVSDEINGVQGSDIAIGLDGELYITWLDFNTPLDVLKFDKSTNGGISFGTDTDIASGPSPVITISSSNISMPSIAADISNGPGRGNIYAVWCDARNGDPDVFISKSTNRGANWSEPFRINRDQVGNGKLQCWPWIEVDEEGNIAVLYYSSENTTSNNVIEAYLAWSNNQGASFVNSLLSTEPSPTNQPNTAVRFGDYICLDYYSDRIVPVWTDERAGGVNMEIYTALYTTPSGIAQYSDAVPTDYNLYQNYPNPFNPETKIRFDVASRGAISLKVYDMLGREVASLAEGIMDPGSYEVSFDASVLSGGVYFYRLQSGNYAGTKKLTVLK
ncbi:MAG: T9SS type A sorting domain-containing protein [Ignavibacteria bacterium]|nr:T9SS type A sorting domain-containing protein [Ignavibacteria bacterium]